MNDENQMIEAATIGEPSLAATEMKPKDAPIVARRPIDIRPATLDDMLFIDALQKRQSGELGFLPFAAIRAKIVAGDVLIAETRELPASEQRRPNEDGMAFIFRKKAYVARVGYLIAADRYQKRDELGYIVQLCIVPEYRRSLVAAQLLQAQFDRSAYGCRLYCCWCAQDLRANAFWEAMGFTAIAFRTGGKSRRNTQTPRHVETHGKNARVDALVRQASAEVELEDRAAPCPSDAVLRKPANSPRVHIFWQKRIRAGDTGDAARGGTPFWYPSQTGNGQLRADRLVFPIPEGVHWSEVGPIEYEGLSDAGERSSAEPKRRKKQATEKTKGKGTGPAVEIVSPRMRGGIWFPHEGVAKPVTPAKKRAAAAKDVTRATRDLARAANEDRLATAIDASGDGSGGGCKGIDAKLRAMSRELRDRWGERRARSASSVGKHDVKRTTLARPEAAGPATTHGIDARPLKRLNAA